MVKCIAVQLLTVKGNVMDDNADQCIGLLCRPVQRVTVQSNAVGNCSCSCLSGCSLWIPSLSPAQEWNCYGSSSKCTVQCMQIVQYTVHHFDSHNCRLPNCCSFLLTLHTVITLHWYLQILVYLQGQFQVNKLHSAVQRPDETATESYDHVKKIQIRHNHMDSGLTLNKCKLFE